MEKLIDKNQVATAGTKALVVGGSTNLEIEANILTDDIYKVSVGDIVEIRTGLKLGDVIVIKPDNDIEEGMKILKKLEKKDV